mgnify:CR=1 FL=1
MCIDVFGYLDVWIHSWSKKPSSVVRSSLTKNEDVQDAQGDVITMCLDVHMINSKKNRVVYASTRARVLIRVRVRVSFL